jgi:hypothetical protein
MLSSVRKRLCMALPEIRVTNVNPATGAAAGGTAVTITGTGFPVGVQVYFRDSTGVSTVATTIVRVSATSITCDTPAGLAGAAVCIVRNVKSGEVGSKTFTYT